MPKQKRKRPAVSRPKAPEPQKVMAYKVGPYPVEVYVSHTPLDTDDPDGTYQFHEKPRRISIAARCTGDERLAVLFHELTHCAFEIARIPHDATHVETVCEAIAMTFTSALGPHLQNLLEVPSQDPGAQRTPGKGGPKSQDG